MHLEKGCKKVIIASTPEEFGDIQDYVPGANDEVVDFSKNVFSLGSNTANAVAPVLKVLNDSFGIERAFLTTVHGYSNSNRLADVAGEGFRLNRAAGKYYTKYHFVIRSYFRSCPIYKRKYCFIFYDSANTRWKYCRFNN